MRAVKAEAASGQRSQDVSDGISGDSRGEGGDLRRVCERKSGKGDPSGLFGGFSADVYRASAYAEAFEGYGYYGASGLYQEAEG